MSRFNQPNRERRNSVWTAKYKRLLEICVVQLVEMKSVFTFQPIKQLPSTTIKSAKPAATFGIVLFKDQKPLIMLFGGDGHIVLQERRVATTRKRNQHQS